MQLSKSEHKYRVKFIQEHNLDEEQRDKYYILTIAELQESLGKVNDYKAIAFNMTCICEILGLISLMLGL